VAVSAVERTGTVLVAPHDSPTASVEPTQSGLSVQPASPAATGPPTGQQPPPVVAQPRAAQPDPAFDLPLWLQRAAVVLNAVAAVVVAGRAAARWLPGGVTGGLSTLRSAAAGLLGPIPAALHARAQRAATRGWLRLVVRGPGGVHDPRPGRTCRGPPGAPRRPG
jgi:hypothetical protein